MRRSRKSSRVILCSCLTSVVLTHLAAANGGDEDVVRRLRYPKAYNVQTQERKDYNTFTITFEAKLRYPSQAVLEFYGRELKRLGWRGVREPRRWDCFEDLTLDGRPVVYQIGAKWATRKESRMVMVILRYYSYGVTEKDKAAGCSTPSSDVQHVYVQIMPFTMVPPGTIIPAPE